MAVNTSITSDKATLQKLRGVVDDLLKKWFPTTLLTTETPQGMDIRDIILAQMHLESKFISGTSSIKASPSSSIAQDYFKSGPVQNKSKTGTAAEINNISQGWSAWGLGQSMGWNHVIGASLKDGVCEIERVAKQGNLGAGATAGLLIKPGESMVSVVGPVCNLTDAFNPTKHPNGVTFITRQVMSELIILYGKYLAVRRDSTGAWKYGTHSVNRFRTRIEAMIGAYLGDGAVDANGTSPVTYAARIVGGSDYVAVVGGNVMLAQNTNNGAPSAASGGYTPANQKPSGCSTA